MANSSMAIRNILVPLDGSEHSDRALRYAIDFSEKYGANLTLIHVVERAPYAYYEGFVYVEYEKFAEEKGDEILSKGIEKVKSVGLRAEAKLQKGNPAQEIVNFANNNAFDLVVMGSRGLSGIKAFLLGSVSEHVSRYANCPVVIVKA